VYDHVMDQKKSQFSLFSFMQHHLLNKFVYEIDNSTAPAIKTMHVTAEDSTKPKAAV